MAPCERRNHCGMARSSPSNAAAGTHTGTAEATPTSGQHRAVAHHRTFPSPGRSAAGQPASRYGVDAADVVAGKHDRLLVSPKTGEAP